MVAGSQVLGQSASDHVKRCTTRPLPAKYHAYTHTCTHMRARVRVRACARTHARIHTRTYPFTLFTITRTHAFTITGSVVNVTCAPEWAYGAHRLVVNEVEANAKLK